MRFADYITIAFRNIRRQKLRSVLTIFAIVIGATSVTIMLAIVFSAKGFITNQFEQNGTFQQVQVSPQQSIKYGDNNNSCQQGQGAVSGCVKLTDAMATQIAALPHVTGVARFTSVGGAFNGLFYGSQKLQVQQIVAYDADGIVVNHMIAGRDISAGDGPGVLTITSDYADALGFKHDYAALIGKTVTLNSTSFYSGVGSNPVAALQYIQQQCNGNGNNCNPPATQLKGRIIGIASANGPASNSSYTIRVPLSWAREMEEQQNAQPEQTAPVNCGREACAPVQQKVTVTTTDELAQTGYDQFVVKVDQSSDAAGVAKQITRKFGVGAVAAETAINEQLGVFNVIGLILGGIGGIALAVAAVGVVNTMVMSILERTREIGVMRAVGARRSTVSRLFTFEASLLGFFGGIVGILVGYGLVLAANPIINKELKSNGIASSNIITLPPWLIIGVIILTTLIGMFAGLYPAHRAAKLDPVEALHYE